MSNLEMSTLWKNFKKASRRESWSRPLIETINFVSDGPDLADNGLESILSQNDFNIQQERNLLTEGSIQPNELAELLRVSLAATVTLENGSCCLRPESKKQQQIVGIIQQYVAQTLPKPPSDLNKGLCLHLGKVKDTLRGELLRLKAISGVNGLMGRLIDCYHRRIFDQLDDMLENIGSVKNCFVLMKWVLHSYLSPDMLGHPDLLQMELVKKVDLLLLTDWTGRAKDTLLANVKTEIQQSLEKILQNERNHTGFDYGENDIQLYTDTIQCINAKPTEAEKISSTLSYQVREVCFQELRLFLQSFTDMQTDILEKEARKEKPETKHFLKTLNTCKKLKQHLLTNGKGKEMSLFKEIVKILEDLEDFTLKLLKEIIMDTAEMRLKKYFKTENKELFQLFHDLKEYFPKNFCLDVQEAVADEAYKLVAHMYLKHFVGRSFRQLKRKWSVGQDIGKKVEEDSQDLHNTISELAPGVQQCNGMLLRIKDLLESRDVNSVKLTVAHMQQCPTWSEDMEFVPTLLKRKSYSGSQIREVLEALPDEPRPEYRTWYCRLACC